MLRRTFVTAAASVLVAIGMLSAAEAEDRFITVASTTSTQDSGLFDALLPAFTAKTGITVKVIAQGTGQALDTARRGDADVVFVHAKAQELKFLEDGFGVKRYPVMYNDFVVVGPKSDPAGIAGGKDVAVALKAIADKKAPFVSRGDKSGTHSAELKLWKAADIDLPAVRGEWYREIGQGMGRDAQHGECDGCLHAVGSRHLDCLCQQGRPRHRRGRRQEAVQTNTASCWSIRQRSRP